MTWWARLWSPCWLGHQSRVVERDPHTGRLLLVCPRCRHAVVILREVTP